MNKSIIEVTHPDGTQMRYRPGTNVQHGGVVCETFDPRAEKPSWGNRLVPRGRLSEAIHRSFPDEG